MEGGDGDDEEMRRSQPTWTAEDDALLRRLVKEHGPGNWPVISAAIANQTEVSCRLRWLQQLRSGAENILFAPEGDAIIVEEGDPDVEDGGGEAAEVERTRCGCRDCILGIFILMVFFLLLALEFGQNFVHVVESRG